MTIDPEGVTRTMAKKKEVIEIKDKKKAYQRPVVEKKDNLKDVTLLSFTPPAP